MPELPELEVVRDVLQRRIGGRQITGVTLSPRGAPIVAREQFLAGIGNAYADEILWQARCA